MEKDGNGSRFVFYQAKINGEYLLWLHQRISSLGYAKTDLPEIKIRKKHLPQTGEIKGEYTYYFRFRTFTFSSFNWIYEAFYPGNRKIIPKLLETYLTPLALAIWMMDDGVKVKNRGFKFSTNSFTLKECKYLSTLIETKYNLKTSIHKSGLNNQYNIYILKSSLNDLKKIVKPHFHSSMFYKINAE